jgi:hypothetical protein
MFWKFVLLLAAAASVLGQLNKNPHIATELGRNSLSGTTVAQSTFASSAEGWTRVSDSLASSAVVFDGGGSVSASDTGAEVWYFSAPAAFSGDLSAVYNGRLTFTLGSRTYNDNGAAMMSAADVLLDAACGHSMYAMGIITPSTTKSYSVTLNEENFLDSRTGSRPNVHDFLGVLNNLASIRLRGGFWNGAETTALSAVGVSGGKKWFPCCNLDNSVDICHTAPSPYFNPPDLSFYCHGSLARRNTRPPLL